MGGRAARLRIGHLAGSNRILVETTERTRTASWVVRRTDGEAAVRALARSDKGGAARSGWLVR